MNVSLQATALASECTEYLDQSQSTVYTTQHHKTNAYPIQHQDPSLSSAPLGQSVPAVHGLGPNSTTVSLSSTDSSILQTFRERFCEFSPERFQEVKAQASALPGSRGMRVWNAAWLRCQEARQQLQERMQDVTVVYHQQPDSGSWCEDHVVDVVSTNVQTAPPGGQSLVVHSTPGPRHPQWESIVSGAVDLGMRKPKLDSNSPKSTTVACYNIIIKPEDHSDTGNSQGSKAIPQSPNR